MYRALYIHIPFCKARCSYCDFSTQALPQISPQMDAYLEQLTLDIRKAVKEGDLAHIRSIYLGGGTPTHFGHARLVELAYTLSLSINLEQVEEYTVEANPESLTPALMKDLYALGVNRLSIGVQSFLDEELAVLGRIHNAAQARDALANARERFENISLDLMCGFPTHTQDSWRYTLEQALLYNPEHISIYPLQCEEDTPLTRAINTKALHMPDEDQQADLLEQAAAVLEPAGYCRYEVASYAKPGRESLHNMGYWSGVSYLGLGEGAASMRNAADGSRERWLTGQEPELLQPQQAAAEDLMLAMRMSRGVDEVLLAKLAQLQPGAKGVLEDLCTLGLVEHRDGAYRPTQKGWLMGNELSLRLWQLAEST